jgi:hypothetical protein
VVDILDVEVVGVVVVEVADVDMLAAVVLVVE